MILNKIGKILVITAAGVVSLLVIGIALLLLILPSPYKIKESLKLKPKEETIHSRIKQNLDTKAAISQYGAEGSENSQPSKDPTSLKNIDSQLAFETLIDSSKPLSEVCRTLTDMNNKQMDKLSSAEFGKRFQDSLLEKSSDPLMASLKPVLKLTLTQPSMQTLISKVQESQPSEHSSLMSKMDFYSSAYDAYQEMNRNKQKMEHVLDQSYLTMMLGRAIEVRPDLAHDPRILRYCEEIEKVLNEGLIADFSEEKRAFLDFLSEVEIDPKAIGFDHNYQTHLQIVFDKTGLRFNGGWIDKVFTKLSPKSPVNQ